MIRTIVAAVVLAACLQFALGARAPMRGLRAEYFAGPRAEGPPAIAGVDPDASTEAIQRRWLGAAPLTFAVRWYGFLAIERAGRYTFSISSDDGSVLSVDGRTAIDNGGRHGLQTQTTTLTLDRGTHSVVIDFTQMAGPFAFEWKMSREGDPLAPVPEWALTIGRVRPEVLRAVRYGEIAVRILLVVAAALGLVLAWLRRGWFVAHPRVAALIFFAVLSVVHTWPLALDPAHLTRHDNRDAILNEWITAWVAHQLPRAPFHLFDANIFHPERYTLAYSEAMILQGVLAMPLLRLGASIVLTYNLLLLAGMTLSAWTMTLVVQRWTRDWTAGVVAGALFAFNAHSLSRIPHLQAQHIEFIPLVLFAFDRALDAPTTRNALKLAGWFVLQSLTSVYLLVITVFALIASGLARIGEFRKQTLAAMLGAGALGAVALTPFLLPYWLVSRDLGLVRTIGDAGHYAASWSAYLSTPARIHAWWSSGLGDGNVLFPGALGLALAVLAIVKGDAMKDRRARMCIAIALAGIALSFGPRMPGYSLLYAAMPLLRGIRATARFGFLAICGVAMLAGFGTATLRRLMPARMLAPLSIALVVVASLESLAAPLGLSRFEAIPPIYAQVPRAPHTVVLELPFFGSRSAQFHAHYMLNSTKNWQPIVNGYSGFQPPSFYANVDAFQNFPDAASFTRMRELGVTHVFVHGDQMPEGTLAAVDARSDIERVTSFGAIVLYRLK